MNSSIYHINVCGSVTEPACKQSAVCRVSGSGSDQSASSFGISKAMTMDFKHDEEAVLMQYGGGDPCPPGTSALLNLLGNILQETASEGFLSFNKL